MPSRNGVEKIDFPHYTESTNVQDFLRFVEDIKSRVRDIVSLQKEVQYQAPKKIKIQEKQWKAIHAIIKKSKNRNPQYQDIILNPVFVAKLHMIYGDSDLVSLIVVLIQSGILGVSESDWNKVMLELETKVYDIDPKEIRDAIISQGGSIRYEALVIDDYLDRKDKLLSKNGDRKMRTRFKVKPGGETDTYLTAKREITPKDRNYSMFLRSYIETLGEDIPEDISEEMKILLEEEMNTYDKSALEDVMKVIRFGVQRSKIKLRRSYNFLGSVVENDDYFWVEGEKGDIPPFLEVEAKTPRISSEIREKLGVQSNRISTGGSQQVFKDFGVKGEYLTFGKKPHEDRNTYMRLQRILTDGLNKMSRGYFKTF